MKYAKGVSTCLLKGFPLTCSRRLWGTGVSRDWWDVAPPPVPLTRNAVVGYLEKMRLLHRSSGVSLLSSRVRFAVREFLVDGILKGPFFHDERTEVVDMSADGMNEVCATSIVLTCGYFELSIFECGYGTECVKLLSSLWSDRLSSSLSPPCSCEAATDVGKLVLSVLGMLTSGTICMSFHERGKVADLLCKVLLPNVFRLIQEEPLFVCSHNTPEAAMSEAGAVAFSTLISAVTRAAVLGWMGADYSSGVHRVAMGMPHFSHTTNHRQEVMSSSVKTLAHVDAIRGPKLAMLTRSYVEGLNSEKLRRCAPQVLRFFTLTQCVPQLVTPPDNECKADSCASFVSVLVECVTALLAVTLDGKATNVSHLVASIASSYARILSFREEQPLNDTCGSSDSMKSDVERASGLLFRDVTIGVQNNILYQNEALSAAAVLLSLCERVTPYTNKYLFSDLAALLSSLAKIYKVVVGHFSNRHGGDHECQSKDYHRQEHTYRSEGVGEAVVQVASQSRFQRRRFLNSRLQAHQPESHDARVTPREQYCASKLCELPTSSLHKSPVLPFRVSVEDIAEIEGEMEVLLASLVTVMERHMPSARRIGPVRVAEQDLPPRGSALLHEGVGVYTAETVVESEKSRGDHSGGMRYVPPAKAKALGGRSRLLRKTITGNELILIAEGLHNLSWYPFVAFQDRLLSLLSSELGQEILGGRQYASLVCLLLRAPPVPASVVLHAVGDRLKRLIHSDAVVVHEASSRDIRGEGCNASEVVLALAHSRTAGDEPISLYDSCSVVFAFTTLMGKNALSLLYDLFVRCGQRVLTEVPVSTYRLHETFERALIMFVASSTWVVHNAATTASTLQRSEKEESTITFIIRARAHAASALSTSRGTNRTWDSSLPLFSLEVLAHACIMLEHHDSESQCDVGVIRDFVREVYKALASRCDSVEVVRLLARFVCPTRVVMPHGVQGSAGSDESLQLPLWMIVPMKLPERFAEEGRLLTVAFLPFLKVSGDNGPTQTLDDIREKCVFSINDLNTVLDRTRRYCRNFATLIVVLRFLYATDVFLLRHDAIMALVLRKITQTMRRTCKPLDLFIFFAMYGDAENIVDASLRELVPGAHCFTSIRSINEGNGTDTTSATTSKSTMYASVAMTEFLPIAQITAAVKAVQRLESRSVRQRWLAVIKPLVVAAAKVSREPLDVVLDLAELIKNDDPQLLYDLLTHSAAMCFIDETCSFTADSSALLRLLLLLPSGNSSNPTIRRLHVASRKLLVRPAEMFVPSLTQLAQVILLPSIEETALGRQLRRVFFLRVSMLLFGGRKPIWRGPAVRDKGVGLEDSRGNNTSFCVAQWNNALDELSLPHWLLLLRYSPVGKASSHRFLTELRQQTEKEGKKRQKPCISALAAGEPPSVAVAPQLFSADGERVTDLAVVGSETEVSFDRRFEGIYMFRAFSDDSVISLRESLGASHFIAFVNELLSHNTDAAPFISHLLGDPEVLCGGRLIYEGTMPLPSVSEVRKFVDVATFTVKEMADDLGTFLRNERQNSRQNMAERQNLSMVKAIPLNLGALLKFLVLLDLLDVPQYEKRLMGQWVSNDPQAQSVGYSNAFVDTDGIPIRHLYRILLQLPDYWCATAECGPEDVNRPPPAHPTNISAVFDYCASTPEEYLDDGGEIPVASSRYDPHCCQLGDACNGERPLISDVWIPISSLRKQHRLTNRFARKQLLNAMMRCFFRDGETSAVTRSRLAALGPRDLTSILQVGITESEWMVDGINTVVDESNFTAVIELLTDMLPSTKAEDLHKVVLALTPLLSPPEASPHWSRDRFAYGSRTFSLKCGCSSQLYKVEVELRRLLAHIAVVMGNDTERFPMALLLDMIERLHTPHRLISPAAAAAMLNHLKKLEKCGAEAVKEPWEEPPDNEDEVSSRGDEATVAKGAENVFNNKLSLLRSIANDVPVDSVESFAN